MGGNLYRDIPPDPQAEEHFSPLAIRPGLRIERIVSTGQASPADFWYDQPHWEWVLLLSGSAQLRFADEAAARTLSPGDYVEIPPHCRHRVEQTDPDVPTVWLAIHQT